MNKTVFNQILAGVAVAAIVGTASALWRLADEQAKTNERLVRIETKLGITIAQTP